MNSKLGIIDSLKDTEIEVIDSLCLGHFNVLHPGHFRFLNFAASLGRKLCVILKGDNEFSADENARFFAESERAEALSNLSVVDYIFIKGDKTIEECFDIIQPKFLVLGNEFGRSEDLSVLKLIDAAKQRNIKVIFHSGDNKVSVNNFDSDIFIETRKQKAEKIFKHVCGRQNIDFRTIKLAVSKFTSVKTLVIGDLIIDEFISSEPLGMSSEAPVLVVKEIGKRSYLGGAGIVAAHVASLGATCHFLSVAGDDEERKFALKKLSEFGVAAHLILDNSRPTTFKTRYMAGNQKLFRVSRLMENDVNDEIENIIIQKIESLAPTLDNIIVSDFVYGVVTERIIKKIIDLSKLYKFKIFGDVQCSTQVGDVSKFQNFHMIFPTEKEARIAIGNKDDGLEFVAQMLFEKSSCENLIIKLGADGLVAYSRTEQRSIKSEHFPALSVNPIDLAGAGDSVLATVATAVSAKMGLFEASALASIVASFAVEVVGNHPIELIKLNQRLDQLRSF